MGHRRGEPGVTVEVTIGENVLYAPRGRGPSVVHAKLEGRVGPEVPAAIEALQAYRVVDDWAFWLRSSLIRRSVVVGPIGRTLT